MEVCWGGRDSRHAEIVIEGDCPACELQKELKTCQDAFSVQESVLEDTMRERDSAVKALADFETDLRASMRMIRDAKRAVEAEDDHT